MKATQQRIGFVGFGHMAQILCEAILRSKLISHSNVSFVRRDRAKMKENQEKFKVTAATLPTLVATSDLIFLAVRPQQAQEVLTELARIPALQGKWIVSILPGIGIDVLAKKLGASVQIARVMPNIASSVGDGMSVLTFGSLGACDCGN